MCYLMTHVLCHVFSYIFIHHRLVSRETEKLPLFAFQFQSKDKIVVYEVILIIYFAHEFRLLRLFGFVAWICLNTIWIASCDRCHA